MPSYTENIRKHTKRRLKERLGLKYNKNTRKHITSGIRRGRYVCLRKQSNNISLFLINDVGSKPFKVVYNFKQNDLVTALYLSECERASILGCKVVENGIDILS